MNRMSGEEAGMSRMKELNSRRWRDGERRIIGAAVNDAVFEMMRKG